MYELGLTKHETEMVTLDNIMLRKQLSIKIILTFVFQY